MKSISHEENASSTAAPNAAPEVLHAEFRRNLGQISRHSIVFFAGTLFTMGAGYLVKVYVARVLGAELLGIYALGLTLVSLTQLLGTIGLNGTAARYVAVYNSTGKFDDLRGFLTRSTAIVVFLNLILSIGLAFGGSSIARELYHAPELGRYITMFAALAFFGALNVFCCQILAGFKDIAKRTVITNFIGSSLTIILTVALLAMGTRMWGYLAAQVAASVVVVALLLAAARNLIPRAARFSRAPLAALDPEIKAFAAASFGMSALDFLGNQADKILLGLFLNPKLVGIYVLASTLSAFIPIILTSVNQIFAPVIADLHAQSRLEVLQKLFQTLTKWVLALSFPLAGVMTIFAIPLMRIFGPEFVAGWPVLVIGAIGQVVNCATGSVGYLLLMSGNQRRLIKVQFVMAAISVLVNLALIPILGIVGAAVAAATINVAGNLWNLAEVRKALRISPYNRSYYALAIPAVVTIATVIGLRFYTDSFGHPWLAIGLALVVSYGLFCGLAATYSLNPDDRMIARSAWLQLRGGLQKWGVNA